MNLESFFLIYNVIGITIWLVVMLRAYFEFSALEMILMFFVCAIIWPLLLLAAIFRTCFIKNNED